MIENVNNSKLLALFNTLEESDKDIVIIMAELLMEKWRVNVICNNVEKTNTYKQFYV
ncbi:MAG: hypothetical protein FWD47_13405 [Treponema sp.]|nr:hypothetical protein [Treponema sp.]